MRRRRHVAGMFLGEADALADRFDRPSVPRVGDFTVGAKELTRGARPVATDRLMTGRIVGLSYGHGTGFIRAAEGQRVYFHRGDVLGGWFNALEIGDAITFDMVEDRLSGLRALRIRKDSR
jgi:cold shock CspA family protein